MTVQRWRGSLSRMLAARMQLRFVCGGHNRGLSTEPLAMHHHHRSQPLQWQGHGQQADAEAFPETVHAASLLE